MRTQWTAKGNWDAGSSCLCDRGLHRYLRNFGGGLNTPNLPSRYATVHMQYMILSLSMTVPSVLLLHSLSRTQTVYLQATRNSHREWQYRILHVYNCILLKMSTWGSKHVEEINIIWLHNNLCTKLVINIQSLSKIFLVKIKYVYVYVFSRIPAVSSPPIPPNTVKYAVYSMELLCTLSGFHSEFSLSDGDFVNFYTVLML